MPGRPKKNRKRASEEEPKNATKLRRTGLQMTCQKCQQVDHNQRICKNEPVVKPPKGKRGRPPKKLPNPTSSTSVATSGIINPTRLPRHNMKTRNRSAQSYVVESVSRVSRERAKTRKGCL